VTPEIVEEADATLATILGDRYTWSGLRVVPRRVPQTWREGRAADRVADVGPSNQASYRTLPDTTPSRGRLKFGSEEEARVFDAFERAQQRRPAESTLGIVPGSGFRALGRTFWPDFLITHRGRAAGVEVDGPHHYGRAAADRSRDRQLEDAGLLFVDRLVVEDTTDAKTLDQFVEGVLARLLTR
jgi:hypothetical protein